MELAVRVGVPAVQHGEETHAWELCWRVAVLVAEWGGVRCAGGRKEQWISLLRWVFHACFISAKISLSVGKAGYLGEAAQVVLRALRSLGVMLGPAWI